MTKRECENGNGMVTPEGKIRERCSEPAHHIRLQPPATPEQADPGGGLIEWAGMGQDDLEWEFHRGLTAVIQDRMWNFNIEIVIGNPCRPSAPAPTPSATGRSPAATRPGSWRRFRRRRCWPSPSRSRPRTGTTTTGRTAGEERAEDQSSPPGRTGEPEAEAQRELTREHVVVNVREWGE